MCITSNAIQVHGSRSNIWAKRDTNWKLQFSTKLRAITLQILNNSTGKSLSFTSKHADQNSCQVSWPYVKTFWATHDTNWKLKIFTKSRAFTLTKQNKSTSGTPGAQIYIMRNFPVKFHVPRSNIFWATCDTSWKMHFL
jgi:hypothetical protein